MILLYFIVVTFNVLLVGVQVKRDIYYKRPAIFFWLGFLYLFLMPSYADIFITHVSAHPMAVSYSLYPSTLFISQFICSIFVLIYIFLDNFFCFRGLSFKGIESPNFFTNVRFNKYLWVVVLFSVFPILIAFKDYGGSLLSSFGFVDARSLTSGIFTLIAVAYLSKIVAPFCGVLYFQGKAFQAFFICCFVVLYFLIFGGSRQQILYLFVPFLVVFLFRRKRSFFWFFVILLFTIFATYFFEVLIYLRNINGFDARVDAVENFSTIVKNSFNRPSPSSIRFAYYYFVQVGDNFSDFHDFSYLFRLLLFWLPSFVDVFNIKPPDFEYNMFYHYMLGAKGSMHPTFLGSIFADSGILFPVWCVVFFFMNYFLCNILKKFDGPIYIIAWSVVAGGSLMWARGSIYGPFIVDIFVILMFFLFVFFEKK